MKEIKTTYSAIIPTALWSMILLWIPAFKQALEIAFTKYTYDNDNLIIKRGVIHQEQLSIPFYRLKDIQVNKSIVGDFLKYGNITLFDKEKVILIKYVESADNTANELREIMTKAKKDNGLKVMDLQ